MKTQLQQFYNDEFGSLEILMIDGKPYFPATDCAKILGYSNPRKAILDHCKGVTKRDSLSQGGIQEKNYIPEGDLYRLIIRSKLPTAERFEYWVFDIVLPSIRKHGAYMTDDVLNKAFIDKDFAFGLLQKLQDEKDKTAALLERLEKDAPKAYYCDIVLHTTNAVTASLIAKDYGMTAVAFNTLIIV